MIALDFLYNNFEMTTTLLFHLSDKNFKAIQQIITSMKAANLAKQIVKAIINLAMTTEKRQSDTSNSKSKINRECFNYGKKSHYTKDCHTSISNKKKLEESLKKAKQV